SHELRTPLFAVLGLAAVLEDSEGLNSVQRDHLATIRSSGEDLQTLISNVLDYSRLESGSMQKSNLELLSFPLRDGDQRKNVELVLATPVTLDPPFSLIGDPFRVKQVLLNLLSNAVKFTSTGSVIVSWEFEEANETQTVVRVHVKDSVRPLPQMDRLFKSFSQIDSSITRSYGGSGLGLAISQSLAQLMGGSCTASSEVGVGSTFSFSFVAGRTSPVPNPFPRFSVGRSAFIVSKSENWASRDVLKSNLVAFGFSPVHPASGCSLALSTTSRENLLSVSLQELAKMKEKQPKAKFFYLTRSIELSNTIQKLSIPHSSIISRPLKAHALYASLTPSNGSKPIAPAKSSTGIDKEMARKHPLQILLVDDNQVNCVVGKRILERFGYTNIATAYDGKMAVDMAEQTRFDLVLMILDGYAANTRIAASPLAGRPIVVALSANTDDDTRDLVAREGFFFYLTKPMVINVLARILVEAHAARVQNQSEGTGSPGNQVPSPSKKMRLDPEPRSEAATQPTRGGKEPPST
ncbi:hypothetical protein BDY24DRAFT_382205, partial [Mrakia frigida]|uniref:uncharacterized protein n=1 Tax=Mrakia frigida TaxID=29902 RepID=UPI003FCC0FF7